MIKPLLFEDISDPYTRESFRRIEDYLLNETVLKGQFKFFEYTFTAAVTARDIPHKLSFRPKDVIMLSATGGATVTWLYDNFTDTFIRLTTTAATTVRAFIGRYEET